MSKLNKFDEKVLSDSGKKQVTNKLQHQEMTKKQIMEYIGFTKFKNRLTILRIVKSLLLTFGVAFFVGGLTLILTMLNVWEISPWFSLLFMALTAAITFVCVFFPLSVNDKKLAIKLDEKFSLKERMQTSFENVENNRPMSVLLRHDLKKRTGKISSSKIKAKGLIACIAVAAIGVVTLMIGLGIVAVTLITYVIGLINTPADIPQMTPPSVVEVWELSGEEEAALQGFATMVETSDMVSPAKEELVSKINELITKLKATTNKDEAEAIVISAVLDMDLITYNTGSSGAIYTALRNKDSAFSREIARALTRKEQNIYRLKMEDAYIALTHKYASVEEPTKDQQTAMNLDTIDVLAKTIETVNLALAESGVDPSDNLYKCIYEMVNSNDRGLVSAKFMLEDLSLSYKIVMPQLHSDVWETIMVQTQIYDILLEQNKNYEIGYGASDGIRELFGLQVPTREDLSSESPRDEDESIPEDEKQEGAGGYGPGELLGTDELIYVKEYGNTIITYAIYNNNKEQMIKIFEIEIKDENGEVIKTIPPEMEKYFKLLLDGYEGEE